MTKQFAVKESLRRAFPCEPVPSQLLLRLESCGQDDIAMGLCDRIEGQSWCDIQMYDWTMIGVRPSVFREYMIPGVFVFYLPSLLVGGLKDFGYIDYALEALIPNNKTRTPRGEWWRGFEAAFDAPRIVAVNEYLDELNNSAEMLSPSDIDMMSAARTLWGMR